MVITTADRAIGVRAIIGKYLLLLALMLLIALSVLVLGWFLSNRSVLPTSMEDLCADFGLPNTAAERNDPIGQLEPDTSRDFGLCPHDDPEDVMILSTHWEWAD